VPVLATAGIVGIPIEYDATIPELVGRSGDGDGSSPSEGSGCNVRPAGSVLPIASFPELPGVEDAGWTLAIPSLTEARKRHVRPSASRERTSAAPVREHRRSSRLYAHLSQREFRALDS
jgi:hypothetical protein